MKNDLISIVVPVYKVEKYLNKCLESLTNQTLENVEIILVDDGSPDSCPQICDEWAKKDRRIKVIHKQNGGVGSARNVGIDFSSGKYVGFIDPDDDVDHTMFEKLYSAAEQNDADMVMCGFKYRFEDGSEKPFNEINLTKVDANNILKYYLKSGTEIKKDGIYTENIMGSVCRTLLKKSFINDARFSNFIVAEDLMFLMNLITPTTKISIVNEQLYTYLQRGTSVIHTFSKEKMEQRYKAFKLILENVINKVDEKSISCFKFYNYASLANEMLKNGQIKLLKEYMSDPDFASLNSKEGYQEEQKNTKSLIRKFGYFLIHKRLFKLYSLLVKFS